MDTFTTIAAPAQAQYSQLRSKFIGYVFPAQTPEEALEHVARIRQEYYDARHVCWAYRLGHAGELTRQNDDGEPSGTAGKPIFGQLLSAQYTNIVAIVVRYFGGVKLGTSGLIEAYREATALALAEATPLECIIDKRMEVQYGYELMGEVMRYIKDSGASITLQDFRESCRIELSIRADDAPALYDRLSALYGLEIAYLEDQEE